MEELYAQIQIKAHYSFPNQNARAFFAKHNDHWRGYIFNRLTKEILYKTKFMNSLTDILKTLDYDLSEYQEAEAV